MTTKTPQQQIKAKLESLGIPFKAVDVYGRQIVVTCFSRDASEKFARVIAQFAKVRRAGFESVEHAKVNKGTNLNPSVVKVWRTYAVI